MVKLSKSKLKFLSGWNRAGWKGQEISLYRVRCVVSRVDRNSSGKHIVRYTGHSINGSGYFYAEDSEWELHGNRKENRDDSREMDELVLKYLGKWFGPVKQADYNPKLELQHKGSGRVDPGEEWGRSSFSQVHNGTAEDGTLLFFRRENLGKNNMVSEMGLDWWFVLPDISVQAGKKEKGILSDTKVDEGQPEQARQMAECCERDIRQIFRCVVQTIRFFNLLVVCVLTMLFFAHPQDADARTRNSLARYGESFG